MRTRNEFGTCYACPSPGRKRVSRDGRTYTFACAEHVVVRDVPHPKGNRKARRRALSASPGGGKERGRTWAFGPFIAEAREAEAARVAREKEG